MESIKTIIECEECKNKFNLNEAEIKKEWVGIPQLDDAKYCFTYLICSKCKKIYIVQADNNASISTLQKALATIKKIHTAKRKNDNIPVELHKQFKKSNAKLNSQRKDIMNLLSHKTIRLQGEELEVKFYDVRSSL